MEGLLNESPTYDTSHPTRSHREIKCWPVVSCELIGSATICIYSYRMQCCRPYTHTYIHTLTHTRAHTHTHIPPPPHTTQSPHTRNAHTTSRDPLCLVVLTGPDWLNEWHTHTHTHTHTHVPTAQENAQKQLQTCTASRHYHLDAKFDDSCGYSRLKSCSFEQARVTLGAPFVQTISKRNRAC